jgi:chromosome segregation ATPase
MSDLLQFYEKDFRKSQDLINKNVDKIYDYLSSKTKKEYNINEIMDQLENLIDSQQKTIKKIEIEVSSTVKREDIEGYNSKISSYKRSLELNKTKYRELEEKINLKEASMIVTDKNQLNGTLLKNEQLAYAGNQKLQEAKRKLAETEDVGNKIMVNMDEQTNVMKNTNNKLKGMNSELDESNSILNRMKSRIKKNKNLIKYLSILFAIILSIVIIYKILKNFRTKK